MTFPMTWLRAPGCCAVTATVVASLLLAPPGAAAEDGPAGSAAVGQTAVATTPNGPSPQLKPGPKISQKQIQRRNNEKHAGARPLWVQLPILQRKRGKYSIFASATVSTHRGQAKYREHTDEFSVSATIIRKGQTTSQTTPVYRKRVRIQPRRNGLVTVRIPVTKAAAKDLKTLEAQKARIIILMQHSKDTFPKLSTTPDLHQVVPGQMTLRKLTKQQVNRQTKKNLRIQRRMEKGKQTGPRTAADASLSGATLARRNMNSLLRNQMVVNNNTPFTQGVVVNPNVACMRTEGLSAAVLTQDLAPVTGSVQFFTSWNNGTSGEHTPWAGSTSGNPPVDGGASAAEAMAESGRDILNHLTDEMWSAEFYSSKGLIAAGLATGVSLIVDAIKAAIASTNKCDGFGQYWAVTATAKTVGTLSNPGVIYGTPDQWARGSYFTEGKGFTQANLGVLADHPSSLPVQGTAQWNGLVNILNSAVGQQTSVTYFDNGGMSAPVANAGGRTQWNGHAAYAQGLIQYLYPNVPSCQNNDCNNGTTAVQLGYLVDGFNDVVGPKLLKSPTVTAESIIDPNTGQKAVHLECTIQNNGNFSNPFGGTQKQAAAAVAKELNSLPGAAGVDKAEFAVTYYAQDAKGSYLYAADSVTSSFPGPIVGSAGAPPPNLKPNGDGLQTVSMNQATPAALNLLPNDLDNLVNPTTGLQAEATQFGCAVIPVVSWKNMDVTAGSQWGGRWPFPQAQSEAWLSSPWPNEFNWPNPVNALNVTWTGDTYLSPAVKSPVYLSPTPTSVSPAQGPVTGQTNLTITGQAFQPGATVTVGGVACTSPVVVDSETLTCVTGAVSAADVRGDVVVTNPLSEDAGTGKDLFTFTAEVTGVSPASGSFDGGTRISISGIGFGRDSTVMVGNKSCKSPVVASTKQITCITPAHALGAVNVAVTNPRPLSTSTVTGAFTFVELVVQVDAVYGSPTTAGGKDITIYGPQLTAATTVTVGGKECTDVRHYGSGVGTSNNYVACKAPAQPAAGTYDVVVSVPGYKPATIPNGLKYS